MAEQKKTAPKTAAKPEVKSNEPSVQELMAQIEQMKQLLAQVQAQPPVAELREQKSIGSTKVKVMSLLPYKLNLTTEPMGGGKAYTFRKYGEAQKIRFSDLEDIVHNHRKNMEDGVFYICDPKTIEELELTEEYEAISDKVGVDSIVALNDDVKVEMFLNLSDAMKESVARMIAEKINEGVQYNLNYLSDIQRRSGMDILGIAESLKIE